MSKRKACTQDDRDRMKRNYARKKALGLCVRCAKVESREGKTTCLECSKLKRKLDKRRIRELIELGLCVDCKKEKATKETQRCKLCLLKAMCSLQAVHIRKKTGKKFHRFDYRKVLEKLEEQDYKCAYSGRDLVVGVNASMDHIKPSSKHPELWDNFDNIEMVDLDVNRAKNALSKEEFLLLINDIASHLKM